jgi:hypothetical protein
MLSVWGICSTVPANCMQLFRIWWFGIYCTRSTNCTFVGPEGPLIFYKDASGLEPNLSQMNQSHTALVLRYILILSSYIYIYIRLRLSSNFFHSGLPTEMLCAFLISSSVLHLTPVHLSLLQNITNLTRETVRRL